MPNPLLTECSFHSAAPTHDVQPCGECASCLEMDAFHEQRERQYATDREADYERGAAALTNVGVHAAHCCLEHGCKYGDDLDGRCPVVNRDIPQDYPCEHCDEKRVYLLLTDSAEGGTIGLVSLPSDQLAKAYVEAAEHDVCVSVVTVTALENAASLSALLAR